MVQGSNRRRVQGLIVVTLLAVAAATRPAAQQPRPMTFLDMQQMKNAGSPAPSPNGQWMLYTMSTPDWQAAERQSDIYLVSMTTGVSSSKQLTFTTSKNETVPRMAA